MVGDPHTRHGTRLGHVHNPEATVGHRLTGSPREVDLRGQLQYGEPRSQCLDHSGVRVGDLREAQTGSEEGDVDLQER